MHIVAAAIIACLWAGLLCAAWAIRVDAMSVVHWLSAGYMGIRAGTYTLECAIGATPLKTLECGVLNSVNLLLSNLLVQVSEFMSMVALSKNMFGAVCAIFSVGKLSYTTVRCAIAVPLRWAARFCARWTRWLYHALCEQLMVIYEALCIASMGCNNAGMRRADE